MTFLWLSLLIFVGNGANLISAFPPNLEIINGENATINNYPWMVSLWTVDPPFNCGGFLISSSWVMSAADCTLVNITHVRGGSNKTDSGGILVEVEKMIRHEDFNWYYLYNDIAVLKLKTPLVGDNIKPIELPDPGTDVTEGAELTITGWGTTVLNHIRLPDTLQEVNMTVVDLQYCKDRYEDLDYGELITENVICAQSMDSEKGPCFGDSGNPALWNGKLVGIVSFAAICASNSTPTGFTKVSNYVDWIYNVTGI